MNYAAASAEADNRIRPFVRETPLDHSLYFSQETGAQVYLKLENLQYTGSFKARGAMNKLLTLDAAQRARGVVAASSGNHGAAVAYGAHALGVPALVFVPEHASPTKLAAMRRYGAEVRFAGDDSLVSETGGAQPMRTSRGWLMSRPTTIRTWWRARAPWAWRSHANCPRSTPCSSPWAAAG